MRIFGKPLIVYAISALLAAPISLVPIMAQAAAFDKVYMGGTIYTMEETDAEAKAAGKNGKAKTAEVVFTQNGKIVFAGTRAAATAAGYDVADAAKIVNLDGRTMLPGFIDPHGHFPGIAATNLFNVNLYPTPIGSCDTLADLLSRLDARAKATPLPPSVTPMALNPLIIIGAGYDDTLLDIKRHPTADELETVADGKYIQISHISGHATVISREFADLFIDKTAMISVSQDIRREQNLVNIPTSDTDKEDVITDVRIDGTKYQIKRTTNTNWVTEPSVVVKGGKLTGLFLGPVAASLITKYFPNTLDPAPGASGSDRRIQRQTALGSQTYAAAGVTTANQSDASPVVNLPAYREALFLNNLGIRVVIHPADRVYNDDGGYFARKQLGWTNSSAPNSDTRLTFDKVVAEGSGNANTRTRVNGNDLTLWSPFSTDPKIITTAGDIGVITTSSRPPGAERLPQEKLDALKALPDRILLGPFKIGYDGSSLVYTGYFKDPGYYDLGGNDPFNPSNSPTSTPTPIPPINPDVLYGLAGSVYLTEDYLQNAVALYHKEGQGVTVHANGSWGNEDVVEALEKAVAAPANSSVTDTRHTIIHAQTQERQQTQRLVGRYDDLIAQAANALPREDYVQLEGAPASAEYGTLGPLMKAQNIVSSYYVDHTYFWGDRHKKLFMGQGRAQQISPLGWAIEYDHTFTSHNNTPMAPISGLRTVEAAVTRIPYNQNYALTGTSSEINAVADFPARKKDEGKSTVKLWDYDQRISVLQALRAITINSAYSNKLEDRIGSIEKGKYADFVIIHEDPFNVDPTLIADSRVMATIVSDKKIYGYLPDTKTFVSEPTISTRQGAATDVTLTSVSQLTGTDLEAFDAALKPGEVSYGAYQFRASCSPNGAITIYQMDILGNGARVEDFELRKLLPSKEVAKFNYTLDVTELKDDKDKHFWITQQDTPTVAMRATEQLIENHLYVIYFVVKDNGEGKFDADIADGKIADPVSLVAKKGGLPSNQGLGVASDPSSGSSGCTVGTNANYGLLFLLCALMGVVVFRTVRRKA